MEYMRCRYPFLGLLNSFLHSHQQDLIQKSLAVFHNVLLMNHLFHPFVSMWERVGGKQHLKHQKKHMNSPLG
jgi:hypothetical protein